MNEENGIRPPDLQSIKCLYKEFKRECPESRDLGQKFAPRRLDMERAVTFERDSRSFTSVIGEHLQKLPPEVQQIILSQLNPRDLEAFRQTSTFWRDQLPWGQLWFNREACFTLCRADKLFFNYIRYSQNGPFYTVSLTNRLKAPLHASLRQFPKEMRLPLAQDIEYDKIGFFGVPIEGVPQYETIISLAENPLACPEDIQNLAHIALKYRKSVHFCEKGGIELSAPPLEFPGDVLSVAQTDGAEGGEWIISVSGDQRSPDGFAIAVPKSNLRAPTRIIDFEGEGVLIEARSKFLYCFSIEREENVLWTLHYPSCELATTYQLEGFVPHSILNTNNRRYVYAFDDYQSMWIDTVSNEVSALKPCDLLQRHAWPIGATSFLVECEQEEREFYYRLVTPNKVDRLVCTPLGGQIVFVDSDPTEEGPAFKKVTIGMVTPKGHLMRHDISVEVIGRKGSS